jgi:hypothetical protein
VKTDPNSTEIKGVRKLTCEEKEAVVCDFTVSNEMLASPNLAFVLDVPVFVNINGKKTSMPSADFFYFELKDIPVSHLSIWNRLLLQIERIFN